MSRTEWLMWVTRWGTPGSRAKQVRRFLMFEMYRQLCRMFGFDLPPALERKPLSAGRYLAIEKPVPFGVRLLDLLFASVRDEHAEYVRYSPECEQELRAKGVRTKIVDISYEFRISGAQR